MNHSDRGRKAQKSGQIPEEQFEDTEQYLYLSNIRISRNFAPTKTIENGRLVYKKHHRRLPDYQVTIPDFPTTWIEVKNTSRKGELTYKLDTKTRRLQCVELQEQHRFGALAFYLIKFANEKWTLFPIESLPIEYDWTETPESIFFDRSQGICVPVKYNMRLVRFGESSCIYLAIIESLVASDTVPVLGPKQLSSMVMCIIFASEIYKIYLFIILTWLNL